MQNAYPNPQLSPLEDDARRLRVRSASLWGVFLLLGLWSGYNTGIGLALAPNFPSSTTQLIQGVRAFFPLVAGWLAIMTMLKKGGVKQWAIAGPLGLMGVFVATGLISSGFLSKLPVNALYWGGMYGSVLIVMIAICSEEEALTVLFRVITASWMVDFLILLGLLGAIPFLSGALAHSQTNPLGVKAYAGNFGAKGTILGMPSTRNTGLARYAAVAGLAAFGRLWNADLLRKITWGAVLLVALYALVLTQGRTETLGFLAGFAVILMLRKSRRIVLLGVGMLGVVLMGLLGFFRGLWEFGVRAHGGHHFDWTLTGRVGQWMAGLKVTMHSPLVGFGFQADRYYLHGIQLEGAVFQALIQSGILGTLAYVAAFALAWFLVIRLYTSPASHKLPDEIPGMMAFFTIMSLGESTVFYGADWMLLAPVLAYIQVAAWQYGILGHRQSVLRRRAVPIDTRRRAENLR